MFSFDSKIRKQNKINREIANAIVAYIERYELDSNSEDVDKIIEYAKNNFSETK